MPSAKTLVYISLSSQKTLQNSIHASIISMLQKRFEKVLVLCRGKNHHHQEKNVEYYSGNFPTWWNLRKIIPQGSMIYSTDFFLGGAYGVLLKKLKKSRLVLRCASPWEYQLNSLSSILKHMIAKITKPFVLKSCDKVVYNSQALINYQYPHNYTIVYNGIDTALFKPIKIRTDTDTEKLKALFIGNLNPEKGLDYLFPAVENLPGVDLSIVGDGKLLEYYRRKYHFARFYGRVERLKLPEIINQHDLLVLPTFVESFPNVLLEAMACGKPVIATNVFGIPEMVKSGRNGLLVPAKSSEELRKAIAFFLENRPLLRQMGVAGRRTILRQFEQWQQLARLEKALFEHETIHAAR